jgi:hypothetical protein
VDHFSGGHFFGGKFFVEKMAHTKIVRHRIFPLSRRRDQYFVRKSSELSNGISAWAECVENHWVRGKSKKYAILWQEMSLFWVEKYHISTN